MINGAAIDYPMISSLNCRRVDLLTPSGCWYMKLTLICNDMTVQRYALFFLKFRRPRACSVDVFWYCICDRSLRHMEQTTPIQRGRLFIRTAKKNISHRKIFFLGYVIDLVSHSHLIKIIYHLQHNFSYSSNSTIKKYTKKMIFINDICFSSGDMAWLIQPPINCYHSKDHFSSYNIYLIDFWNR